MGIRAWLLCIIGAQHGSRSSTNIRFPFVYQFALAARGACFAPRGANPPMSHTQPSLYSHFSAQHLLKTKLQRPRVQGEGALCKFAEQRDDTTLVLAHLPSAFGSASLCLTLSGAPTAPKGVFLSAPWDSGGDRTCLSYAQPCESNFEDPHRSETFPLQELRSRSTQPLFASEGQSKGQAFLRSSCLRSS